MIIGILITPDLLGKRIKALRKLIPMEVVEIAGAHRHDRASAAGA